MITFFLTIRQKHFSEFLPDGRAGKSFSTSAILYYGLKKGHQPKSEKIRPYYFIGDIDQIATKAFDKAEFENLLKTKVNFKNLR